jgi:hypothetical protein
VPLVVLLAAAAALTWRLSKLQPAAPSVERATVWVDTVKRGPMLRDVKGTGTLVPEGTVVPPGSLFMGHPGKLRRALTPEEIAGIDDYATRYVALAETYRNEPLAGEKGAERPSKS